MKLQSLRAKLLAAARSDQPSDRVPYAFEQRIMARLREQPVLDLGALWTRILWRAAGPSVALALVLGAWLVAAGNRHLEQLTSVNAEGAETAALSHDFDQAMLAVVDEHAEEIW